MIKDNEPYLIEYNIRLGDPECQVILPRLKTDLLKIINATLENKLKKINIKWKNEKSMTIVLCSRGYPGSYKKYLDLTKVKKIKISENNYIYHAGTKILNDKIVSCGGRILNIPSLGHDFLKIRNKILATLKQINLTNGFYRKDIGWRVIK